MSGSKIVRDGFPMPEQDYRFIAEFQNRLLQPGLAVTKSMVLRAALRALHQLPLGERLKIIGQLESVKTGRSPLLRSVDCA